MIDGWVKTHRALLEHPIIKDPHLARLWLWCLLSANTKASQYRGESLAAGEFVTGRISASQQLSVSPSKWYRDMQKLEEMGCIKLKANSNWTTVSVCNWRTYQARKESERTADEQQMNNGWTADEQRMDTEEERKNLRKKELNTGVLGECEKSKPETEQPPPFREGRLMFDPTMLPMPDVLATPTFRDAWSKWCNYLTTEKGCRLAQTTAAGQLASMARDGPTVAIQRIQASIEAGWIKLAETPKTTPLQSKTGTRKQVHVHPDEIPF
jgi:hypothetical protein